jgi:RNA polymerase sigma factor (sigma-70 family)
MSVPQFVTYQQTNWGFNQSHIQYFSEEDQPTPVVYVISDDPSERVFLENMLASSGLRPIFHSTLRDYFATARQAAPGCLAIDTSLHGLTTLDLQQILEEADGPPIVFMAHVASCTTDARRPNGDPFEPMGESLAAQLLRKIGAAIKHDQARRHYESVRRRLKNAFHLLAPRERDVFRLVTQGLMNKQIAAELELSEVTVKIHRGRLMKKMEAPSLADLVRMADHIDGPPTVRFG